MTSPKIQFREVEPAEVYLRQVDSLRSKLCRVREALYGEWDGELSNFVGNIEDALSSTGPCRHEEEKKVAIEHWRMQHDDQARKAAERMVRVNELEDENRRLKEYEDILKWADEQDTEEFPITNGDIQNELRRRRAFTTKDPTSE